MPDPGNDVFMNENDGLANADPALPGEDEPAATEPTAELNAGLVTGATCSSMDLLREEIASALQECEAQLLNCFSSCKARIRMTEMQSKTPISLKSNPREGMRYLVHERASTQNSIGSLGTIPLNKSRTVQSNAPGDDARPAFLPWQSHVLDPAVGHADDQDNPAELARSIIRRSKFSEEIRLGRGLYASSRSGFLDLSPGQTLIFCRRLLMQKRISAACSKALGRLVSSPKFDAVSALAILANSVILGMVVDNAAQENPEMPAPDEQSTYDVLGRIFTVWFTLEVSIRFGAEGFKFFYSKDWTWNIFDLLVVGSDLTETIVEIVAGGNNENLGSLVALRVLRVLRITRAIRVIRLVRFFRELRMMVFSILRSGTCLVWSLVMLYLIIYIFGIYFVQAVTEYRKDQAQKDDAKEEFEKELLEKLKDMFGSIILSHYTLFQAVSGGLSWGEISDPLMRIHWSNAITMCFFIFFTVFAVMNIITGIFVETATHAAHNDREEVIQAQLEVENSVLWQMRNIFIDADKDSSGTITHAEFEEHLADEQIRAHLSTLGLEVNEARGLFTLLDLDQTGDVLIDEFVTGCMRLKGNAKTLDMAMLMYENKRMFGKLMAFFDYTNVHFSQLKLFEKKVEVVLERLLVLAPRGNSRPSPVTAADVLDENLSSI